MSCWGEKLNRAKLSKEAVNIILHSIARGTARQYQSYIQKWAEFCASRKVDPTRADINNGIEFLTTLFQTTNIGYSSINTARSALSLILEPIDGLTFGNQPLVRRFMSGIFKLRPALPRYTETYDVNIILDYLAKIQTSLLTPLVDLSHKLAMLLCLLSAQRNQSLAELDINFMSLTNDYCHFYIPALLKTTKPGRHTKPLELNRYAENLNLCPVALVTTYLAATAGIRNDEGKLFLSYRPPHRPVTSSTLARWCKHTLRKAGINCKIFSAHSTRSAATSNAYSRGLNLQSIRDAAGWSSARTFATFYHKPIRSNFGDTILQ